MVTTAVLVDLFATTGQAHEVERLLAGALPGAEAEPGTAAWFGVRFGRHHYGVVAVFRDDAACDSHLDGPAAVALLDAADDLLDTVPEVRRLDVLAAKLPDGAVGPVTKGMLLTFEAKEGHVDAVERFLESGRGVVEGEAGTLAWFALRFGDGRYGIFDVFADNGARFAHLTGHIPRDLARHSLELLGSFPDIDLLEVLESTLG